MTTARLPDPARSRALLIGTSEYTDAELPALPMVRNNLADLRAFLTSPHGTGLPDEHCVVLPEPPEPKVVAKSLTAVARQAEDLLLVYYAGHGLIWTNELYLAVGNTDTHIVGTSALRCAEVRQVFLNSPAAVRVLIVDCCFSGRVFSNVLTTPADMLLEEVDVDGVYILTATQRNKTANASDGTRNTAFTGELLGILRAGVAGAQELLTLDLLYRSLKSSLQRKNLPLPSCNSSDAAGHLALARNPAHQSAAEDIALLREQLAELEELQREYPNRVAALRALVDELAESEQRTRQVYLSILDKIAEPGRQPLSGVTSDLAVQLADLDGIARRGTWSRIADDLARIDRGGRERVPIGGAASTRLELTPVPPREPPVTIDPEPPRRPLIGGVYEIAGLFTDIYSRTTFSARDRRDGSRVVITSLLRGDGPEMVADEEHARRTLLELAHPNLAKPLDLVREFRPGAGECLDLVLEDSGGQPLFELAPLELPVALTIATEVLRALRYLHERGLAQVTLTTANVLQAGTEIKLVDLAAVQRISPPEVTPDQDLVAAGRLFATITSSGGDSPPARRESFDRLVHRATHPDPAHRFASANEMLEQTAGVLTEVLSAQDGQPRPVLSARFSPERKVFGSADEVVDWSTLPACLPIPLVNLTDPAAGFLATLAAADPHELLTALRGAPVSSPEVLLRLVDTHLALHDLDAAQATFQQYTNEDPTDWRAAWYDGLLRLAQRDVAGAQLAFDAVYSMLPGELAPQLALAAVAEWRGDEERAGTLYSRIWRADTSFVSAAFGMARVLRRGGQFPDVVAALDEVPQTSSEHALAQVAAIRARLEPEHLDKTGLMDASNRLNSLQTDLERQARLSIDVLGAKLDWTLSHGADGPPDHDFDESRLRRELEHAYRALAQLVRDRDERSRLIDLANQVRPRTVF